MKRFTVVFASSFIFACLGSHASADVLIRYNFNGMVDTSSDTDPNSVASNFVFHPSLSGTSPPSPGFSTNVPPGGAGGSHSRFTRTHVTANNEAGAIANNDYASFSLTANPGFVFNLTSLDMALGSNGVTVPVTANTASFALRSSLDNYATTIGTLSVTAPDLNTVWTTGSISLSGPAFQNLSQITFRMYIYDSFDLTPNNIAGVNRMDNIILNGVVVAVPEPSSMLFVGIAGAACIVRRIRRMTKS